MKSFAFRRPYCEPQGGLVVAKNYQDAIDLVTHGYGGATGTIVYDAETKTWYDKNGVSE